MSTLLYHTGALGDFITTIPAISYYKKRHPGSGITLLGRPPIGKFAQDIGLVTHWLDVDDPRFLPLFHDAFSDAARRLLGPFTTAILFTGADASISKTIMQSGMQQIFRQPPFPASRQHVIDYHLSLFCNPATLTEAEKIPVIVPPAEAFVNSGKLLPSGPLKPVAIHPGSGSGKKNWPFDRFLQVAGIFRAQSIPIIWIKGPAEESFDFPPGDLTASNLSFTELAVLLSVCGGYLGNDSGVSHLAAATGCKTVVLFGLSDPRTWAPRGPAVSIIFKDKSCSPCHLATPKKRPCDYSCLNDISVKAVLDLFS